jgi:hypothetical protein
MSNFLMRKYNVDRTPKLFTFTKDDFSKKIQLYPIAFRAQGLSE